MHFGRAPWLATGLMLAFAFCGGPAAAEDNTPPAGFIALFNGKDLTNWQGLIPINERAKLSPEELKAKQTAADEKMRAHWSVRDGVLVFDGKGDSLQTAKDYGNFELYVDWRIQPKGDSGIYLRGNPQVQIWEANSSARALKDGKFVGSGGLFNNQKHPSEPLAVADKPVGEWNTFHIRMIGDRVTIRLNDQLVVDNTPLENYWERGKPLPARGPIELQNHGNVLEFRNIYLKELPDDAAAAPPAKNVTLEVAGVPLSQVIQLLTASSDVEIVLSDPEGRLGERQMSFISIRNKSLEKALEVVCRAADAQFSRDKNGVYFVTARR